MNPLKQLVIALVCPCYNEHEALPNSIPRLLQLLDEFSGEHGCSPESFVVLVDDGSRDDTWGLIRNAAAVNPGRVRGVRLARNAGHQNALMAGLAYATGKCDAAISLDVDLQDDLSAISKMIAEHKAGAEIVLGVKSEREADSFFKTATAQMFYGGMKLMGVNLVANHADCRLMSAKALRNLAQFPEYSLFLRGLQPLLHQRLSTITYPISPRPAGQSKYSLTKMLGLAIDGITSFSVTPLRLISCTGAAVSLASLLFAINGLVQALMGRALPGWASITVPLYLLGGVTMLSLGIVGEYVGKIYLEVKQRPRYLIDETLDT
jgi:glycosyltransferase involved in cell wall biosynthesis